jgi:hypothetical protein
LEVAQWWGVDPQSVGRWSIIDFEDREEYMLVKIELEPEPEDETGDQAVQPGEVIYKGPQT